jgi:hypothetical protein
MQAEKVSWNRSLAEQCRHMAFCTGAADKGLWVRIFQPPRLAASDNVFRRRPLNGHPPDESHFHYFIHLIFRKEVQAHRCMLGQLHSQPFLARAFYPSPLFQ